MKSQSAIWDKEYKNNVKWHLDAHLPNICRNKRVLELGVGSGKTLRAILRQKPKHVTAIDFSKEALSSIDLKNKNVTFIRADIQNLPFEDDTFDIVVCHYVLDNLLKKQRETAASEIRRVLKSNGLVLFEDFAVGDFRESLDRKQVENQTIEKANGIICHFFKINELKILFKFFANKKFKLKVSRPIIHKLYLKRKIISGIMKKA